MTVFFLSRLTPPPPFLWSGYGEVGLPPSPLYTTACKRVTAHRCSTRDKADARFEGHRVSNSGPIAR